MPELPAGTVTFLFTDIEGSTALLKQLGRDGYESVLSEQAGIVRAAVDAHHGQIVDTQGDSFFAAFRAARDAVAAAADVQRELAGHDWPDGVEVKVRMGLHSGEPKASGERYVGIGVHRAARVGSAGHGGQVLLSDTTRALVEDDLPEGVSLRDLGRVQLKDIDRPEHVYQLAIAGLPSTFPKLKTAQAPPPYRRRGLLAGALAGVIAAAVAIPVFALGGGSGGSVGSAVEANVAADSVGVFDSSRGQLVSQAAVKGGPGAVAAAGDGSVWVTHPDANSVSRIDPKLNAETQTIQVGDDPRAVTVGGGFVWVANSLDGTVWKIDPNANGSGGVVDRFTVGNGPTGLAFGDGRLWVANSTDGTVMEFVPGSHKPLHTFSAAGGADAISYGLGSVWVVSGSGNSVTRIDPSSGTPLSPIGVGNDPGSIATGAGAVWVADTLDGTVYRIDPLTNDRTVISVGGSPSGIAADDTAVWVADERAGRLSKIDPAKSKVVQTVTLARHNRPWGLTLVGSRLFASVGTSASAHRGGTLTVLTASDTLDPAAAGSSGIVNLTNDGLVGYKRVDGSDGTRLVPDLAISLPAPTDGGKTYTFQLQPGIRYSNGALVQPGDFRRGIERSLALFGNSGPSSQYLVGIVGANACTKHRCDLTRGVATTPHTVTFHLTAPDPDFLYKLAFPDADAVPAATPINARLPLPATGPYKFASYNAKRGATLVRNPYFRQWSADAQPAGYPDRIVFKFVPSNQTDAQSIRAVERNRADVTEIGSLTGMLRRQGYGNRIHIGPTLNTNYFFLNTRLAPFDNLQARRAVNFAVDRNRLVALAGGPDFGQPTCQILPPTFPAYLRYCPYPFDLAKARRLVAKSGTKGKTVTVWTPRLAEPGSAYFVSQLQAIGYKARLKIVGQGLDTYFSKMIPAEKTIQTGVASWGVDYASPSDFLGLLVCGPNSLNFAAFCNPRIDREMAAARKLQATNPQAADVIWKKVDHDLVDQAPWVTKANGRQVLFVSRRVGNVEYNPFYTVLLDQLWVR
jgi:peptide/nickel transport system substrate-binding protein